jgi:hypothetical protein
VGHRFGALDSVLATRFCPVERGVGGGHEPLLVGGALRQSGRTEAGGDAQGAALAHARDTKRLDRPTHALGQAPGAFRACLRQHHRQLFIPVARRGVDVPREIA